MVLLKISSYTPHFSSVIDMHGTNDFEFIYEKSSHNFRFEIENNMVKVVLAKYMV